MSRQGSVVDSDQPCEVVSENPVRPAVAGLSRPPMRLRKRFASWTAVARHRFCPWAGGRAMDFEPFVRTAAIRSMDGAESRSAFQSGSCADAPPPQSKTLSRPPVVPQLKTPLL